MGRVDGGETGRTVAGGGRRGVGGREGKSRLSGGDDIVMDGGPAPLDTGSNSLDLAQRAVEMAEWSPAMATPSEVWRRTRGDDV